jgi:hypothetical protein
MEIVVKLASSRSALSQRERDALDACVEELGVALEPLDASADAGELGSFLHTRVDDARATHVVEALRRCGAVEGAYVKPAGEPPRGG